MSKIDLSALKSCRFTAMLNWNEMSSEAPIFKSISSPAAASPESYDIRGVGVSFLLGAGNLLSEFKQEQAKFKHFNIVIRTIAEILLFILRYILRRDVASRSGVSVQLDLILNNNVPRSLKFSCQTGWIRIIRRRKQSLKAGLLQ